MCVGVTIVTDMMATQGQMTREFVVSNLHWRAPDTTALPMQVPNPQGTASQLSKLESNSWPQPEHNQNTRTIATKGSSEKLSHSLSTQQSKTLMARAANYARDSSPSAIHRASPNFSKFGSLWIAPALGRRHEGRELLGSDKRGQARPRFAISWCLWIPSISTDFSCMGTVAGRMQTMNVRLSETQTTWLDLAWTPVAHCLTNRSWSWVRAVES